jgi:hypothetical protein
MGIDIGCYNAGIHGKLAGYATRSGPDLQHAVAGSHLFLYCFKQEIRVSFGMIYLCGIVRHRKMLVTGYALSLEIIGGRLPKIFSI